MHRAGTRPLLGGTRRWIGPRQSRRAAAVIPRGSMRDCARSAREMGKVCGEATAVTRRLPSECPV